MRRSFSAAMLIAAVAVPLTACSASQSGSASSGQTGVANITVAGSTALLPLVKQAVQDYQAVHPDAKISVSGGGSRVGVTQVAQGGVDIGNSDIPADGEPSLVDHKVAIVSFAVVANPAAGITNLTKAQVAAIFSGKVTNFKAVGGKDQTVVVINRPHSSGTRAVFVQTFMNGAQPVEGASTQDSSGTVATIVAQTPGAISYVSTSYVKGGAVAVSIDRVAPSAANVIAGKYSFWSYEHMFTRGIARRDVATFIDFVSKDTAAVKSLGFIPASAVKVK